MSDRRTLAIACVSASSEPDGERQDGLAADAHALAPIVEGGASRPRTERRETVSRSQIPYKLPIFPAISRQVEKSPARPTTPTRSPAGSIAVRLSRLLAVNTLLQGMSEEGTTFELSLVEQSKGGEAIRLPALLRVSHTVLPAHLEFADQAAAVSNCTTRPPLPQAAQLTVRHGAELLTSEPSMFLEPSALSEP